MNCKSIIKIFSAPSVGSPLIQKGLGSDVQVTVKKPPGFSRAGKSCIWFGKHLGHHHHQILWVGSDLYRSSSPNLLPWAGTLSSRPGYSKTHPTLNTSGDGACTTSLGQLFLCQYLPTLAVKNFCQIS